MFGDPFSFLQGLFAPMKMAKEFANLYDSKTPETLVNRQVFMDDTGLLQLYGAGVASIDPMMGHIFARRVRDGKLSFTVSDLVDIAESIAPEDQLNSLLLHFVSTSYIHTGGTFPAEFVQRAWRADGLDDLVVLSGDTLDSTLQAFIGAVERSYLSEMVRTRIQLYFTSKAQIVSALRTGSSDVDPATSAHFISLLNLVP